VNPNQLFLWEKFTTKPYFSAGQFKRVDEIATPCPAFSVIASNDLLEKITEALKTILKIMQQEATELAANPKNTIELITKEYKLSLADTTEWFNTPKWSTSPQADLSALDFVTIILNELELTDKRALLKDFIIRCRSREAQCSSRQNRKNIGLKIFIFDLISVYDHFFCQFLTIL